MIYLQTLPSTTWMVNLQIVRFVCAAYVTHRFLLYWHKQLSQPLLSLWRFGSVRILGHGDGSIVAPKADDNIFSVDDFIEVRFECCDGVTDIVEPDEGVPSVLHPLSVPYVDTSGRGKHLLHGVYGDSIRKVPNKKR